ncbi:hypothetical protein D3C85_1587000 [compost metagenome]
MIPRLILQKNLSGHRTRRDWSDGRASYGAAIYVLNASALLQFVRDYGLYRIVCAKPTSVNGEIHLNRQIGLLAFISRIKYNRM